MENFYKKSDIPDDLQQYFEPAEIGLEDMPELYIERQVEVFREVRRVLRDDGTLWVVIGDTYAGSGNGAAHYPESANKYKQGTNKGTLSQSNLPKGRVPAGCKPKDLIGIPWMLAFALRADGWYLRQDIIWYKGNPMPEAVMDRCTKSHEYIFLLSKSARYYFDNKAIMEIASYDGRTDTRMKGSHKYSQEGIFVNNNPQSFAARGHERWQQDTNGNYIKNKRSVWSVNTKPFSGAHFAVFPPELIRPCILSGSRENGIVLDPFIGSGTTAEVAIEEGRGCIGIELNPQYAEMAQMRMDGAEFQMKLGFEVKAK